MLLVLARSSFLFVLEDQVHDDAKDHGNRDGSDGDDGFSGVTKLQGKSTDAGDEDDGGDEDVLGVAEVDLGPEEALDAARSDEAIENEAHAAGDAGGDRHDKAHDRFEEGEENCAEGSIKPEYVYTKQNVEHYWLRLALFIVVFASLATITLEFIDKDKR